MGRALSYLAGYTIYVCFPHPIPLQQQTQLASGHSVVHRPVLIAVRSYYLKVHLFLRFVR